jgi:hypothetical protein
MGLQRMTFHLAIEGNVRGIGDQSNKIFAFPVVPVRETWTEQSSLKERHARVRDPVSFSITSPADLIPAIRQAQLGPDLDPWLAYHRAR